MPVPISACLVSDGNRDVASIEGGHRSLVSSYPCQEEREKHPVSSGDTKLNSEKLGMVSPEL